MGDVFVKSHDNKRLKNIDANKLHGWAMSGSLPYDEIKFHKNVTLEDQLNFPNDSDFGLFVEVDLSYPCNMKAKTKKFPFCFENRKNYPKNFT